MTATEPGHILRFGVWHRVSLPVQPPDPRPPRPALVCDLRAVLARLDAPQPALP